MCPPTPASPRSVAGCANRIELAASGRAACLAGCWLGVASALAAVSDLPVAVRLLLVGLIWAGGVPAIIRAVLFRSGAIDALDWSDPAALKVRRGAQAPWQAASLGGGCVRLGTGWLLLRIEVVGDLHTVLIDGGRQSPAAFRGLCRHLKRALRAPSGREMWRN